MQERRVPYHLQTVRKMISCNLKVHGDCYGTIYREDWICDSCQVPAGKCWLCPPAHSLSVQSPLRRSSLTEWVHLICNFYIGLRFITEGFLDKEDLLTPVKGLENLDETALCLKCIICGGIMNGFCVNCAEPACGMAFHPFCAITAGLKTEPPKIYCKSHSTAEKIELIIIPPHKIKEEKKAKTQVLNSSFMSHSVKSLKRSRITRVNNDFDRVKEYFLNTNTKLLSKTTLPYDKSGFTLPNKPCKMSSKCRVLFQWFLKDFLLSFKVEKNQHDSNVLADDFIIIPKYGEPALQKFSAELENYLMISKEVSMEYELLSRCLNETIPAEDEVTKEILYSLEYFSRKIIPVVNTNKELVTKLIEKKKKLDMVSVHKVCNESWTCMQWTLIYKNLKAGLEDKTKEYYENRDDISIEIKKIDCSICFNYDEENAILNPIVYCISCRLFMHRACIGVLNPPENYTCQVCLSKSSPQCYLCACKEWPMKCVDFKWFHFTCALWDEKVEFFDKQFLEGISLSGYTKLGSCYICRRSDGLLSECGKCNVLCHLMCAWRRGFKFVTHELSTTHRRLQAGYFCDKHEEGRNCELQKELRYNAFCNYMSPRLKKKRSRENK